MVFDSSSNLPQTFNELSAMLRLDIVEAFVADEVFDLIQPVQWCTGKNQLVEDGKHLFFYHRATFQQNFADGQNLTARQKTRQSIIQQIAAFCGVIQNLPARLTVRKMISQRIKVTLDSLFTDSEAISGLLFV